MAGGVNLYGYAGADPANNSDPFGLCCYEEAARVAVMAATFLAQMYTAPIKNAGADEVRTQLREAEAENFKTSKETVEKMNTERDLLRGPKPLEAPSLMPASEGVADEAVARAAGGAVTRAAVGSVIGGVLGGIVGIALTPTSSSACGDTPCPKPPTPAPAKPQDDHSPPMH